MIFYISLVVVSIPIVLLLMRFRSQPPAMKWLAYSLILSLGCDLLSEFAYHFPMFNQNLGLFLYGFFLLPIISVFFYYQLNSSSLRLPLIAINIVYIAFAAYNYSFVQMTAINSYSQVFRTLIILTLSLGSFYKFMHETPSMNLFGYPLFWICTGLLIGAAGKLVLYGITEYLVGLNYSILMLWTFHNFMSIIQNLLIGLGAWANYRNLQVL